MENRGITSLRSVIPSPAGGVLAMGIGGNYVASLRDPLAPAGFLAIANFINETTYVV